MYLLVAIFDIFGCLVVTEKATALPYPTLIAQYQDGNIRENLPRFRQNTVGVIWRGLVFWAKLCNDCIVNCRELGCAETWAVALDIFMTFFVFSDEVI